MFAKILIANRGEIACRIMRTAARLGIRTVAVYSEADASARHVALADEAVAIGPPPAAQSYLNIANIIEATKQTGAQAIHPGYGFLSENAEFAEACIKAGITFIGPTPNAIRAMGSKSAAKTIMGKAGVALVPGYHGEDQSPALLLMESKRIGFPLLIKASAGGGGKGMRIVRGASDFDSALEACRREAKSAFGDDRVIIEKYLERPRHIEMHVFRDSHGHCVHLFERDCSIQRRHQKIIEEAPAPGMDESRRTEMGQAAVAAAEAIDYLGAGTVEFIVDNNDNFYFMEMNTRLQVEHPVTELITGQDLVEWQLRVGAGEPLPCKQDELGINGHAIEVRIYAEDPEREFLPATGHIAHLRFPADSRHIRIDAGVREGDSVTVHYDPMIAKLIVWDRDRSGCIRRLQAALAETQIVGVTTNIDFLSSIIAQPDYQKGILDTGFIERHRDNLFASGGETNESALALAALYVLLKREQRAANNAARSEEPGSPWHHASAWRMNRTGREALHLRSDGTEHEVVVGNAGHRYALTVENEQFMADGSFDDTGDLVAHLEGRTIRATVVEQGDRLTLLLMGESHTFTLADRNQAAGQAEAAPGSLTSPMPGRVVSVQTKPGESVKRGAPLMIIEAMKMEHTVTAPMDGTVTAVHYLAGDMIDEGAELLVMEG